MRQLWTSRMSATSGDESDRDYEKRSRKDSPMRDSPPKPSSSYVIGEAEVRDIAREVSKKYHEEVL